MVGFPYTKVMNANNAVEQAACFVVSLGRAGPRARHPARPLGVPVGRAPTPTSTGSSRNRRDLGASPAIGIAGRAALDLAGVGVDDLAHVDLYSCFPSAVQIAAEEIGLGTDRPLTVTGGLSFAGGPWNNYVSHSIATMVERLRDDAGSLGLVTANGGYLTKHAFGVYSTTPAAAGRGATPARRTRSTPSRAGSSPRWSTGRSPSSPPCVMHDRDGAARAPPSSPACSPTAAGRGATRPTPTP